jgi:hypothetical protein
METRIKIKKRVSSKTIADAGEEITVKKEKKEKKMKENIVMPAYDDYALLKEGNNKYSLLQLKDICRFHKQKMTGKKEQLAENLYNYLYKSKYALVLQKAWRKQYIKIYNRMRGPARMQRTLCVNETDFYTMEPLADIPYLQFFSYCDDKRKKNPVVYGFDILSLFMLMKNEYGHTDEEMLKNPYTREPFPDGVKETLFKLLRASKRFDEKIIIRVEDVKPPVQTIRESIGIRTVAIFNDMNDLGNYTLSTWFSTLGHPQLVRFIRELYDIWTYRANLSDTVKREICPPYGSPFSAYLLNTALLNGFPVDSIKLFVLELMEQFIRSGVNRDSRYLGTNYILCALTLVSPEAAEALPWLYQSVSYTLPF